MAVGGQPAAFIDQPLFEDGITAPAVAVSVAHAAAIAVRLPATVDEVLVESLNDQEGMLIVEVFNWDDGDRLTCHSSGTMPTPMPLPQPSPLPQL